MVVQCEGVTIFLKVFLETDQMLKSLLQVLALLLVVAIQYLSNIRELSCLNLRIADCVHCKRLSENQQKSLCSPYNFAEMLSNVIGRVLGTGGR